MEKNKKKAASKDKSVILLEHVNKSYEDGMPALIDINLRINQGEFVFIVGSSGAGKSTLLNKFAGVDLSPVTHKPQTTRQNILAICEGKDYQIVFVDTPGFLHAEYKLQEVMLNSLNQAVSEDADLVLFVYDASSTLSKHLELVKKLKELYPTKNV